MSVNHYDYVYKTPSNPPLHSYTPRNHHQDHSKPNREYDTNSQLPIHTRKRNYIIPQHISEQHTYPQASSP